MYGTVVDIASYLFLVCIRTCYYFRLHFRHQLPFKICQIGRRIQYFSFQPIRAVNSVAATVFNYRYKNGHYNSADILVENLAKAGVPSLIACAGICSKHLDTCQAFKFEQVTKTSLLFASCYTLTL